MSVSSASGIIKYSSTDQKNQETTDYKVLNQSSEINLNDVLSDMKLLTKIVNNLTIALSVYLDQRGELDTTRFKLVSNPVMQTQKGE